MFGSGSAGIGIADLLIAAMKEEGLSEEQARKRIYAFNRYGLLVEGCKGIRPGQEPLVRKRADVAGWKLAGGAGAISLLDVVRNARVTVLVGVSAQPGAFTEEIVREMARPHSRAPSSSRSRIPPRKSEAAPADLLRWTDGRALVGTGSPFAPVEVNGKLIRIAQVNNSYHLSRPCAGHSGLAGPARDRRHDHGRGQGARRALAGARRQERAAAAAHRRLAQGGPGGRRSCRAAGHRRRSRRRRRRGRA